LPNGAQGDPATGLIVIPIETKAFFKMKINTVEADRIAGELFKIHQELVGSGSEGLHPDFKETRKIAKALHLFGATSEVIKKSQTSAETMASMLSKL